MPRPARRWRVQVEHEREIVSVNPATLAENGRVPATSREGVVAAVDAARRAQPTWAARDVRERTRVMRRFVRILLREKRAVADVVTRETGKPVVEAFNSDVLPALDAAQWLATRGRRVLAGTRFRNRNVMMKNRTSRIHHVPKGVVGLIAPWNYPLGVPAAQVLFALFAGNSVVLKPSEFTTLTALRLRDLLVEAGVPEDVVHVIPGHGPVAGDALAKAPVDHLVFTGSVETGRRVDAAARANGVPTCLELGGSDPALVLADADLDVAASGIAWGRFLNAGQTCAAVKRVFVVKDVADAFTDVLVDKVNRLRVGDAASGDVDVGPVVSASAVDRMEELVADAVDRGARVVTGGARVPDVPGHFFQPTVLVDVPADARVLREEVFGPVLPVVVVADEDEAVRRANDTPFGLSASVWSRDKERAERLAARLEAGTVVVNDCVYTFALMETPWMGRKASGHGVTHGEAGLLEMVHAQHVNVAPARRVVKPLWWFPYGDEGTWERSLDVLYGRVRQKVQHGGRVISAMLRRRNL